MNKDQTEGSCAACGGQDDYTRSCSPLEYCLCISCHEEVDLGTIPWDAGLVLEGSCHASLDDLIEQGVDFIERPFGGLDGEETGRCIGKYLCTHEIDLDSYPGDGWPPASRSEEYSIRSIKIKRDLGAA